MNGDSLWETPFMKWPAVLVEVHCLHSISHHWIEQLLLRKRIVLLQPHQVHLERSFAFALKATQSRNVALLFLCVVNVAVHRSSTRALDCVSLLQAPVIYIQHGALTVKWNLPSPVTTALAIGDVAKTIPLPMAPNSIKIVFSEVVPAADKLTKRERVCFTSWTESGAADTQTDSGRC